MKKIKLLLMMFLLAVLFYIPAYADELENEIESGITSETETEAGARTETDPLPEPGPVEIKNEIFQSGADSGPQTIPGAPVVMDDLTSEMETIAAEIWETGWNQIKNEQLSEKREIYLDIANYNIYYPDSEGADKEVKQRYDAFSSAMSRVVNDYPEKRFYVSGRSLDNKSDTDTWYEPYDANKKAWKIKYIKLTYCDFGGLTGVEAEKRFQAALDDAIKLVNGVDDSVEKIMILHDYLVSHINYNFEVGHDLPAPTGRIYRAYGALVDGDAVCNGYALAFKAILNRLNIANAYVASVPVDNVAHAWNLIEIDGQYYHVDVTWDDGSEGSGYYKYFLLSDETFKKVHVPYNSWRIALPPADSKKYETGWFFNGVCSSIYRHEGQYYAVKSNKEVLSSSSLHSEGTNLNFLERDLHIRPNNSYIWDNGYVYYIYWDSNNLKKLMAFHLNSAHYIQVGEFDKKGATWIGLRCENGKIIPSDSNKKGRPALMDGIPLLPPQPDAKKVVKDWNDHIPDYYYNGKFYSLNTEMEDIYTKKITITADECLGALGTNPDTQNRNLQAYPGGGRTWLGGYLYYIDWGYSEKETLMAFQLDTGKMIQVGQVDKNKNDRYSLRYDDTQGRIVIYSGQNDLVSFPTLPEVTGDGITVFDGGKFAIAQASLSDGKNLWIACYDNNRMTGLRQETLVQPDTYWYFGTLQLDAIVIPLRQGSERVRVFLLDSHYVPVVPAA